MTSSQILIKFRTPLIINSTQQLRRDFNSLPSHIRSQYTLDDAERMVKRISQSLIDPNLVVEATVRNVYARRPPLNTVVAGYLTMVTRYSISFKILHNSQMQTDYLITLVFATMYAVAPR